MEESGRTDMLFQFFWTLCQFISSFAQPDPFRGNGLERMALKTTFNHKAASFTGSCSFCSLGSCVVWNCFPLAFRAMVHACAGLQNRDCSPVRWH